MESHAANHLDVEVAHADDPTASLANDGEGLGKEVVERCLFGGDELVGVGNTFEGAGDASAKFDGLGG